PAGEHGESDLNSSAGRTIGRRWSSGELGLQGTRVRRLLGLAGVLVVGLAGRAGEEARPRLRRPEAARSLRIDSAELWDLDHSGSASAGDEVVLALHRPRPNVKLEDLELVGPFDDWGTGARVVAPGDKPEIRVVLGTAPTLSVRDTYRPGTRVATPAQVRTATGSVPILIRSADRTTFVGDRFPDSEALRPYYGQLHAHTGLSDGE